MAFPMTVFIFLGGLSLRLISGDGGAMGLSLVFVLKSLILGLLVDVFLVFFCRQEMAFWVPGIDVQNIEERLQISLCLYMTCLFHHFLPTI